MSTNTTNMAMGKAVDGDNAKTYLETTLGAALDKLDAHDHSGTTHGVAATGYSINNDITYRRAKTGGTALANADFALSAGWGSTATATAGVGSDSHGSVTITSGGSSIAGNPTCTLTFKDGTWTTAPTVLAQITGGTGNGTASAIGISAGTTTVIFQTFLTPVSGNTYTISWIAVGGPS